MTATSIPGTTSSRTGPGGATVPTRPAPRRAASAALRRAAVSAAVLAALAGTTTVSAAAPALAAPAVTAAHGTAHGAVAAATAVRGTNGDYELTWTAGASPAVTRVYAATDPAVRAGHRRLVTVTTGTDVTVTGLDPLQRWYFALAPAAGPVTVTAARAVTLDGVANSRDLGGYPAAGGLHLRWGAVFRSARLTTATDTGARELAALRLAAVVDFRTTAEATAEGLDPLPPGTAHIADPVGDPDQAVPPTGPPSGDPMADNYRLFVSNPNLRKQFADGLDRAADLGRRPLMFHCTGGNHRTGWMSVVLLKALGVPDTVVRQDYLLSPNTSGTYLDAAYDEVRREYGSFSAYLTSGLGIPPKTIAALRARLLVRD